MSIFQFMAPPMPHYIISNMDTYTVGDTHPARNRIGVFDLIIVTRGCLYLSEDDTSYQINAGHYLVLRPDRNHHTEIPCTAETHFYWLHFQTLGRWYEVTERSQMVSSHPNDPYSQIDYFPFYIPRFNKLNNPAELDELVREINLLSEQPFSYARWKQQVLFQELLLKLQEGEKVSQDTPYILVTENTAAYLRQHYMNSISYKELGKALHFHPNYISQCMKKVFGYTPLEFLTRYRIEQAKLRLIHTNESIGQISENTGFGSFPYFVRCFIKHTGMRPRAFRLQFRV
jgi:YesN/AraC family two-component response regulator